MVRIDSMNRIKNKVVEVRKRGVIFSVKRQLYTFYTEAGMGVLGLVLVFRFFGVLGG